MATFATQNGTPVEQGKLPCGEAIDGGVNPDFYGRMKYWTIYKFASKLVWLGRIEAKNEAEAIEKASLAFKVAANRLIAELSR